MVLATLQMYPIMAMAMDEGLLIGVQYQCSLTASPANGNARALQAPQ